MAARAVLRHAIPIVSISRHDEERDIRYPDYAPAHGYTPEPGAQTVRIEQVLAGGDFFDFLFVICPGQSKEEFLGVYRSSAAYFEQHPELAPEWELP